MKKIALLLGVSLVLVAGCKKKDSPCEIKCKKMLTCYEEGRGAVSDGKAAVSRCAKMCSGKASAAHKAALEDFDKLSCGAFIRKHSAIASALLGTAKGPAGRTGPADVTGDEENPFPELASTPPKDPKERRSWKSPVMTLVDRIELIRASEAVELKRTAASDKPGDVGEWSLVKPEAGTADRFAVRNLLTRLERMGWKGRADIAAADFAKHQLDDQTGVRCKVYAGEKLLADMIVGKPDRSTEGGRAGVFTLVRKGGTDEVYRATGSLSYIFQKPAASWRDSTVITLKREELTGLTLVLPSGTLALKRDAEDKDPRTRFRNWQVAQATPALPSLDQNSVTRLVSVLTNLRATSFVTDVKAEQAGLDKPAVTLTITEKGDKTVVLLIGNRDEAKRAAYAQVKGDARIFLVRTPLDELATQTVGSFRDKTLVDANLNEVVSLTVEKQGKAAEFKKDGTQWNVVRPTGLNFDRSGLIGAIRLLEGRFTANEFAPDKTDAATAGLDKPEGKITVVIKPADANKPQKTVEILVGKVGPKGDTFVQVAGQSDIFLMRKWVLSRVYKDPPEWEKRAGPDVGRPDLPGRPDLTGRPGLPGRPGGPRMPRAPIVPPMAE
jgi:hypothetical protein